jgi:carboxymethylenebutenolidase
MIDTARTTVALATATLAAVAIAGLGTAIRAEAQEAPELPPDAELALSRLAESPRHGEWIEYDAGDADTVTAWVVYPERSGDAPVMIVIHEIFGLTDWVRGVADRLAAEGFITIAPDLLSGKGYDGGGTDSFSPKDVRKAIGDLDRGEVNRRLRAAAGYATALPSATSRVGSVGFCWGGSTSFRFATAWDGLDAAIVYYGSSPPTESLASIEAPVLGLYGGDDARVDATIPPAKEEMDRLGKVYETEIYDGAGHGFLRQQSGREGKNLRASEQAWARTLAFLRAELEE